MDGQACKLRCLSMHWLAGCVQVGTQLGLMLHPLNNQGKFSNKSGKQIRGPLSAGFQHDFGKTASLLTCISVPGPQHTF